MQEKPVQPAAPLAYDPNYAQPGQPAPAWQQQQPPPASAPLPPPVASQPGHTTLVVQAHPPPQMVVTAAALPVKMSSFPAQLQCPSCQNHVTTLTYKQNGALVWLAAGILILFGLWLGCCLIPFCIPSLKDTVHVCPVCKFTIGKHSQL